MITEKIVILDHESKNVYVLDYDSNIYANVEDFFLTEEIVESGLIFNSCDFMIVPSESFSIKFGS